MNEFTSSVRSNYDGAHRIVNIRYLNTKCAINYVSITQHYLEFPDEFRRETVKKHVTYKEETGLCLSHGNSKKQA